MNSVRFKLTALFLVTVFVCIAATGVFSMRFFTAQYMKNLRARLLEHTHTLELALREVPRENLQETVTQAAERLGGYEKIRITVIDGDGTVLADSESAPLKMDNHIGRPEIQEALRDGTGSSQRLSKTVQRNFLYVARSVRQSVGDHYFIRVAAPAEMINETLSHLLRTISIAALAALLFSFVITSLITSWFTTPVRRMKETSGKIAGGDLSARTGLSGTDEFSSLAQSIDHMADSIQQNTEAIEQRKSEIENILRSMRDGLVVVDMDKRILLHNDRIFELYSIEKGDYRGRGIVHLVRHKRINDAITDIVRNGTTYEADIEVNPITGETLNARGFPFRDDYGRITGAIILIRDITEIKKLETVRTEFIENASHELRTPVTLIRGFVETLLGGAMDDPEASRRFLELLDKESRRLVDLAEDILTLEKAEKRRDDSITEPADAVKVIQSCLATFSNSAAEKGLSLESSLPDSPLPVTITPDEFQLVVRNLVDNAIKFTDTGTVAVELEKTGGRAVMYVSDSGEGIPPADQERIFERFYRVDKSRSRIRGGTGLGLSIVKHLLEKRSGSISVESTPGSGARFTVTLPLA